MTRVLFTLCAVCALVSCNNNSQSSSAAANDSSQAAKATDTIPKGPKLDTVASFQDHNDSMLVFKSPMGNLYTTSLASGVEDTVHEMAAPRAPGAPESKAMMNCNEESFAGTDRRAAKVSIATATQESIDFDQLLSGLPLDNVMIAKHISKSSTSNRIKEEKRNVKITNVFLYAIKRETDNDYHIIIGNQAGTKFLNIENAGLPKSSAQAFPTLHAVRDTVENYFQHLCTQSYRTFNPAIPIDVEGSLFYDIDHAPGSVGPAAFKPTTSWEIHPITKITFKG
jgi:hypothetical protein